VGEEEEYTLEKSFTERNVSFGDRSVRSPEVVAAMEREGEGKKERMRGRKKRSAELLWTRRAPALVAPSCPLWHGLGCHVYNLGRQRE
jgi:hypothetical protein